MEPGFALADIDTSRPHPARMYDFYLGGKDNYAVDQEAAREILQAVPEVRDMARENRAFLQRAVRFLVGEAGIRQIIDIGTGIPAAGQQPARRMTPLGQPGSLVSRGRTGSAGRSTMDIYSFRFCLPLASSVEKQLRPR